MGALRRRRILVVLAGLLPLQCAPVPPAHGAGGTPIERVVFFGDSLIHRSDADHGLIAQVQRDLERREPARRFEFFEAGRNGDTIADLKDRLQVDVLAHHPNAVVLYWDSDVSDVEENALAPDQVSALRAAYKSNLGAVLRAIERAGARVILSGPTLLGERPPGQNPRDAELDAYVTINRRLAEQFRARYLDTRRLFFERIARGDGEALTEDGEHLSEAGVELVEAELVRLLAETFPPPRPS